MNVALVVNPRSGRGLRLGRALEDALMAKGIVYERIQGSSAEEAINSLNDHHSRHAFTSIISCGGDGLAHSLFPVAMALNLPLMVAPGGTGNDFSRHIGTFDKSPIEIIDALGRVPTSRIDMGQISISNRRVFFGQILSTGFDSLVNERANGYRFLKGKVKYVIATLRELPTFIPRTYELTVDGVKSESGAMLVAIANGSSYGGGMKICPAADSTDGYFDILILKPVPLLTFLRVFPKVFKGRHLSHPAVEVFRGREISISSKAVAYADGERVGELPIHATVMPLALSTWIL